MCSAPSISIGSFSVQNNGRLRVGHHPILKVKKQAQAFKKSIEGHVMVTVGAIQSVCFQKCYPISMSDMQKLLKPLSSLV